MFQTHGEQRYDCISAIRQLLKYIDFPLDYSESGMTVPTQAAGLAWLQNS